MQRIVEELGRLVDALDDADPSGVDDSSLHEVAVVLQRLHGRLGVAAGRSLTAWERRGVWAADQSRSASARLSRELNCSTRTSSQALRRARRLDDVPVTVDAVRRGVLSPDDIELLADARRAAPEQFAAAEAMLVGHCSALRFVDAQRVVAYWRQHVDPDGAAADATDAAEAAVAHASETIDGTVIIDARLGPIADTIVVDELRRLADQLRLQDGRDGVVRTGAQRLAAALEEMAVRSAAAGTRRAKPRFTVLLGDDTFTRLCELSARRIVPPAALVPYIDDAVIETVLFDGPRTVVSVSKKRSFTGALRRAIEVRDRHCQHPAGCDIPVERCDMDHIIPWPESQRTDQGNGRLECTTHNRHPDRHDTDAVPQPHRAISYLEAWRIAQRWHLGYRHRLGHTTDDDPPDTEANSDAAGLAG